MVKVIQDQQAEIEALKAENTAMKAKVETLDTLKAEVEKFTNAFYGSANK